MKICSQCKSKSDFSSFNCIICGAHVCQGCIARMAGFRGVEVDRIVLCEECYSILGSVFPPPTISKYWVSWYHYEEMGQFELPGVPCWECGAMPLVNPMTCKTGDDLPVARIYIAAIKVPLCDGLHAVRDILSSSYEEYVGFPDIRFAIPKPEDWSPFCERFPRADWMVWDD